MFIKVKTLLRLPKMAHLNTPPHVHVTVWKYLHNAIQMFSKERRRGFSNHSSVEAAVSGENVCF